MQDPDCKIIVGQFGGPYGVRGWIKLTSYTRPRENIFSYSPWLIEKEGQIQEVNIDDYQLRGERVIVKLKEVDTPEAAREFILHEIAVSRQQLPPANAGEYYWCDLIGLEVQNQHLQKLGVIKEITETGANDVLIIEDTEGGRLLIPFVHDVYVAHIDLDKKCMRVNWEFD